VIHVLIAEDDPDCMKTLTSIIAHRGYVVHTAADGIKAAEAFLATPEIIVVISDYSMGGELRDGDAFFTAIREELERRKALFIISSGVVSTEKRSFFEAHGVRVIEKYHLYNKDKLKDAFAPIEGSRV
jgi:CheY-like chemotaxis protein